VWRFFNYWVFSFQFLVLGSQFEGHGFGRALSTFHFIIAGKSFQEKT